MKRKMVLIAVLTLAILTVLTGCTEGRYTAIMSLERNSENAMEMSYFSFDGYKQKSLNLDQGDELEITMEMTTDEGDLTISVIGPDGDVLYEAENIRERAQSTLVADKDGTYRIKIKGNHKGGFKVSWNNAS